MKHATLTLNPCLDKTLFFEKEFAAGRLNRAQDSVLCAGGKGLNVSRVLRQLGGDGIAYGFSGGDTGVILEKLLAREEINHALVHTRAQTRMCMKMIDAEGVCTEANEAGGPILKKELATLLQRIHLFLSDESDEPCCFFLSGSVPAGIDKHVYADLIRFYKEKNVRFVLDADGEALAAGVAESPYLIKPNLQELSGLMHFEIDSIATAVYASRRIAEAYGTRVLCTLGEQGSVYTDADCSWQISAPRVPVRGFTGAGDTYLAAFLYLYHGGMPLTDALQMGAAMAAAKVASPGTAIPTREEAEIYRDRVSVTKIEL